MFRQFSKSDKNPQSACINSFYKQRGYNLVEVVIGMLVLSIGILGMATMQVTSKRLSYDALQRSIATTLAHDIIERMRANPKSLSSYVHENVGGGSIASEPQPNCKSPSVCTPENLVKHDLWEWEQAMDGVSEQSASGNSVGGLASPRACVTESNGLITVSISWKGYQSLGNPSTTNKCGTGLSLYGVSESERQLISLTTFISDK